MSDYQDYDVIVVGGGTAGSMAAIAAARTGARTLVVEKYGYLGGLMSLGMHMLGSLDGDGYWALGGYGRELLLDLVDSGYATRPDVDSLFGALNAQDPEALKLHVLRMAADAGVEFLFHSVLVGATATDGRVRSISVANKAGIEELRARTFVDCSGDADLVARVGGEFTTGRDGDGLMQPVSNIFKVSGVDLAATWDYLEAHPQDRTAPQGWSGEAYSMDYIRNTPGVHFLAFHQLIKAAKRAGDFSIPRHSLGIYTFPGRDDVGINLTRVHGIDGTNPRDVSRGEVLTQLQTLESIAFLRKYVPGFETCYLVSAPHQLGVRETRHIVGSYTLTRQDVMDGRDFDDQVGRGAYPLDIHDVAPGERVLGEKVEGGGITLWKLAHSYGIPLRTLIPNGLQNVTVGGRCISADHEAAGSVRGQAVCMVTGHAAGTIAAIGAKEDSPVAKLSPDVVQQVLREQSAVLERTDLAV